MNRLNYLHNARNFHTLVETGLRAALGLFAGLGLSLGAAHPASAADIYVAQSAIGASNGSDCGNAKAPGSLNGSDWTAGNTIHLCGTFNMPSGENGTITVGGSGAAGRPITILFESGAKAQAPYFGTSGFITATGKNYIVVDGGSNGQIENTANGAALANQRATSAIFFSGVSNSEIKNLTIANMFVGVNGNNNNGTDGFGINWTYGSNNTVDHVTLHDCRWCIAFSYQGNGTTTNIQAHDNKIYNCDHGISVGSGNNNAILAGSNLFYNNQIHDFAMFDDPANNAHHDGFHIFAVQSGAQVQNIKIYNNHLYGDPGDHMTGYIFTDAESGGTIQADIFNNLIVDGSTQNYPPGALFIQSNQANIYNNTIVGSGTAQAAALILYGTGTTFRNNIISTWNSGIYAQGGSFAASDNNVFYNVPGGVAIFSGKGTYTTLASWQASSGNPDAHSSNTNPNLSAAFVPNQGSAAIALGANLTSVGMPALDHDLSGDLRPISGSWTAGAYNFGGATPAAPAAPTGLAAIVN